MLLPLVLPLPLPLPLALAVCEFEPRGCEQCSTECEHCRVKRGANRSFAISSKLSLFVDNGSRQTAAEKEDESMTATDPACDGPVFQVVSWRIWGHTLCSSVANEAQNESL